VRDDVRAVLNGTQQVAALPEGVVHDDGHAEVTGDGRKRFEVGNGKRRIAEGLDVEGAGAVVGERGELLGTLSGLVKRTVMPSLGRVTLNRLYDPPYRLGLLTRLSPLCATVRIATSRAACPDATARAAVPPSSAAMRSSSTALVGFMMRE
jgi:hypothetical protein